MKRSLSIFVFAITLITTTSSCKKEAGEGGNSSITGKVWVEDYNATFTTLNAQYAGADEYVYIIYGDNTSYGDRIKTSPDGSFEFKYLRKGDYTIYVYSKDKTLTSPSGQVAVQVKASISKKKEQVDIGKITIYN